MDTASIGLIVGCVVGGLVVTAVVIAFIVWCILKCQQINADDTGSMKSKISTVSEHPYIEESFYAGADGVSNHAYLTATLDNDMTDSGDSSQAAIGQQLLSASSETQTVLLGADSFSEQKPVRMSHRNRMSRTSAKAIAVRKDHVTGVRIPPARIQSMASDDVCIVYDERTAL